MWVHLAIEHKGVPIAHGDISTGSILMASRSGSQHGLDKGAGLVVVGAGGQLVVVLGRGAAARLDVAKAPAHSATRRQFHNLARHVPPAEIVVHGPESGCAFFRTLDHLPPPIAQPEVNGGTEIAHAGEERAARLQCDAQVPPTSQSAPPVPVAEYSLP